MASRYSRVPVVANKEALRKRKAEALATPVKTSPTPRASATARERASANARFKRTANWQPPGQAKKVGAAAKKKTKRTGVAGPYLTKATAKRTAARKRAGR